MTMGISDELRETAGQLYQGSIRRRFIALADRIDSEMAELPRGKDEKPIHVGETVYDEDGREYSVDHIVVYGLNNERIFARGNGIDSSLEPSCFMHERPDSWERIAYDVETVCAIDDEDEKRLRKKLAERIRRLAEREDGR